MMLALFNFHVLPFSNSNEKLIMVAFMKHKGIILSIVHS